ncbi:MAG: Rossmann-like and DUF2520 domain-containing protein [Rhodothermia bacterium]
MDLTFAIVGQGSVGSVLKRSLEKAEFGISAVLGRNDDLASLPDSTGAVAICTPDGSIAEIAEALSGTPLSWSGRVVFHVSGALTSEVLAPLAHLGALTLSFHPLSSYPPATSGTSTRDLSGTTVALEGQPGAVDIMSDVAHRLGAVPVVLSIRQKGAYHLAASMASNFLVTLSGSVRAVLEATKLDPHLMDGLVKDTLSNLGSTSTSDALTGPIARGDADTVRLHLETLGTIAPNLIPLYKAMANTTIEIAFEAKRIDGAQRRRLRTVIGSTPD